MSYPLLGVLGGTFDPVHLGHLRPALDVMQALNLERIRFLPNREPPHRQATWLNTAQRKQLLEIAIAEVAGFELDTRELEREGKSYMVDTLESLRADYPGHALCLILGMDAFSSLHQWHQWQRIPQLCHLIVTTRPGYAWPAIAELEPLKERRISTALELRQAVAGRILLQLVTPLDISASAIREHLEQGHDVKYLVPDSVYQPLLEIAQTL